VAGERTRFKRRTPLPRVGDRFGELTVTGYHYESAGGVTYCAAQCSCGASPHRVSIYNLRSGASTRCPKCAAKQSGYWTKDFFGYADIVPDDAHRRRLLNRISACNTRCHSPGNKQYASYGGRGIHVFAEWRGGTEGRRKFLTYLVTLDGWNQPKLELDRIDVDKGYEPGNLRFATRCENAANKRSVPAMQRRIQELEARLRHCTCGAAQSVHDHQR
jgi:hypothetical protein